MTDVYAIRTYHNTLCALFLYIDIEYVFGSASGHDTPMYISYKITSIKAIQYHHTPNLKMKNIICNKTSVSEGKNTGVERRKPLD